MAGEFGYADLEVPGLRRHAGKRHRHANGVGYDNDDDDDVWTRSDGSAAGPAPRFVFSDVADSPPNRQKRAPIVPVLEAAPDARGGGHQPQQQQQQQPRPARPAGHNQHDVGSEDGFGPGPAECIDVRPIPSVDWLAKSLEALGAPAGTEGVEIARDEHQRYCYMCHNRDSGDHNRWRVDLAKKLNLIRELRIEQVCKLASEYVRDTVYEDLKEEYQEWTPLSVWWHIMVDNPTLVTMVKLEHEVLIDYHLQYALTGRQVDKFNPKRILPPSEKRVLMHMKVLNSLKRTASQLQQLSGGTGLR